MRTIADVARLLKVDRDAIKRWSVQFSEHLSQHANPPKGTARCFTDSDVCVLAFVDEHWDVDDEPDLEDIKVLLDEYDGKNDERYAELVYLNTSIFQDTPDDLNETWTHGFLLSGMLNEPLIEVARAYKHAADKLVQEALSCHEPYHLAYPILYTYRHTLELYLKLVLNDPVKAKEIGHGLGALIAQVERLHQATMAPWVADRLREFDEIDPMSDLFRYSDRPPDHPKHIETWVDLVQVKTVMDHVCEAFERNVRNGNERRPKSPVPDFPNEATR